MQLQAQEKEYSKQPSVITMNHELTKKKELESEKTRESRRGVYGIMIYNSKRQAASRSR